MLEKKHFKTNAFWDFSLKVYGDDTVAGACLALQSSLAVDVNLLLFCCWAGQTGYPPISRESITGIRTQIDPFHQHIVKAMRALRTHLRGGFPPIDDNVAAAIRKRILSLEIDCEHAEQDLLFTAAETLGQPSGIGDIETATANCTTYFDCLDEDLSDVDKGHLETILAGCFPNENRKRITDLLTTISE